MMFNFNIPYNKKYQLIIIASKTKCGISKINLVYDFNSKTIKINRKEKL